MRAQSELHPEPSNNLCANKQLTKQQKQVHLQNQCCCQARQRQRELKAGKLGTDGVMVQQKNLKSSKSFVLYKDTFRFCGQNPK